MAANSATSAGGPGDAANVWAVRPCLVWSLDRVHVLGVLNVTPDSFSDGGAFATADGAALAGVAMLANGADGIDIGGESTRPGATSVDAQEQIRRVVPAIRAIRDRVGAEPVITIDTTLSAVAEAALNAGADAVNDISGGLDDPEMLPLVAARACGVILMHRPVRPALDRYSTSEKAGEATRYGDDGGVVSAVEYALRERLASAVAVGIAIEAITLDPGLGFGKSVGDNLALITQTARLRAIGRPLLSALSRKSFTARAAGLPDQCPPRNRVHASVGLTIAHVQRGARVIRVHDVREHLAALRANSFN